MTLTLIAAVAANGVIGRDNQLPWRLKADLARFKALTMGHALIVGRKTFESIGRPLPGRRMIVLSRQASFAALGVEVASSLDEALQRAAADPEVFIGGGADLYAQAMPRAQRLQLTRIESDYQGDAVFPTVDPSEWRLSIDDEQPPAPGSPHRYRFQTWERRVVTG